MGICATAGEHETDEEKPHGNVEAGDHVFLRAGNGPLPSHIAQGGLCSDASSFPGICFGLGISASTGPNSTHLNLNSTTLSVSAALAFSRAWAISATFWLHSSRV